MTSRPYWRHTCTNFEVLGTICKGNKKQVRKLENLEKVLLKVLISMSAVHLEKGFKLAWHVFLQALALHDQYNHPQAGDSDSE